jgi:hypothetical protein
VDVGAEPDVIGEVPAIVVGVIVDNDVIAIPEPVIAVSKVKRANAEIEAAEPESIGAASTESPSVTAANAAGEVAMFPGMIQMEAGLVASVVMSDPFAVVVDVGSFGMAFMVAIGSSRRRGLVGRAVRGRGAVVGNVATTDGVLMVIVLRQGGGVKQSSSLPRLLRKIS